MTDIQRQKHRELEKMESWDTQMSYHIPVYSTAYKVFGDEGQRDIHREMGYTNIPTH